MRYPGGFKVDGKEYKEFKDMNDEDALKVVAQIYNLRHETWEDGIARSISLEKYQELLKKRRSEYVKKSGIFDIKYEKTDVASWQEEDVAKLYEALEPKIEVYYVGKSGDLTEIQNASRIMYLTAISAVGDEFKKRRNTKTAISVAGQLLVTALTIASSVL